VSVVLVVALVGISAVAHLARVEAAELNADAAQAASTLETAILARDAALAERAEMLDAAWAVMGFDDLTSGPGEDGQAGP